MPKIPIQLQPGIDAQSTPALGPTGWNESRNIRFFQGLAQKAGGFQHFTDAIHGEKRTVELRAWAALSGINNLAIAGENRISLFASDVVSDITPKTLSDLLPVSLSTVSGSPVITIDDPFNTPTAGDWIRIRAPISIAGIAVNGPYEITSTGIGNYTITAPTDANATVNNGGAGRVFSTTAGSRTVSVAFNDHGLFSGQIDRVTDPVTLGGITLEGNYVATVVSPNAYTI